MSLFGFIKQHGVKILVFAINGLAVVAGVNVIKYQNELKNAAVSETDNENSNTAELAGQTENDPSSVGQPDMEKLEAIQSRLAAERQLKIDTMANAPETVTETKQVTKQVPKTVTRKIQVSGKSTSSTSKKSTSKPKSTAKTTTTTKTS